MIGRYTEKDIAALWDEENRLKVMLDVEIAVARAWCEEGRIPKDALEDIEKNARFTVERVQEIEQRTQHDVVAFVSAVAENIGENGRYLHLGMTSVKFDASVTEWDKGGESDVDLPQNVSGQ